MTPITRLDQADRLPGLAPRVESSVRAVSLRIYLHPGDDYDACCQMQIYGDRGLLHSIAGAGFYLAWTQICAEAHRLGVASLEGYVREPHARLIERMARQHGQTALIADTREVFGRDMRWVQVVL